MAFKIYWVALTTYSEEVEDVIPMMFLGHTNRRYFLNQHWEYTYIDEGARIWQGEDQFSFPQAVVNAWMKYFVHHHGDDEENPLDYLDELAKVMQQAQFEVIMPYATANVIL